MEINLFLKKLIAEKNFLKQMYDFFSSDPDFIENNTYGFIDADCLNRYIDFARNNYRAAAIMDPLLMYRIHPESITNYSFQRLMRFPKKQRRNYAISMAHTELPFYQLQHINRMHICTEAFAQLAVAICKHDCFNVQDIHELMNESEVPQIIIKTCVDYIRANVGDSEKLKALEKYTT